MEISSNQEAFLHGKIVAICELILQEEIGIILGSRKIVRLKHQLSDDFDEDFAPFIGIDSQTDHLPVDSERKNWSVEALKIKDKEISEHELDFKADAFSACKKLIQRFQHKLNIY